MVEKGNIEINGKPEAVPQLAADGAKQRQGAQEVEQLGLEAGAEEAEVEDLSVDPYVFMQSELAKKGIFLRRSPYRPGMEWAR
jgi:hypothetical protein